MPSAPVPPPPSRGTIDLPVITFLFTLDQVASMINVSLSDFKAQYCYFHMRNTGRRERQQMIARNIAPDDETPDWRIAHEEFARWLQFNGYRTRYGVVN